MKTTIGTDVIIDQEFANLLPAQSEEEVEQLRRNIVDSGLLSPLVVWYQHDEEAGDKFTLIDGHTRYRICQEEGLQYDTVELSFDDRAEVMQWIYENQRGRRNWSAERESYVRGKVYNERKRRQGERTADGKKSVTSEVVAAENGVSARTIQRDGDYAKAVDRIAAKAPELKPAILDGKAGADKTHIQKLANAPEKDVEKAVAKLKSGPSPKKRPPQTSEVLFAKMESAAGVMARTADELADKYPDGGYPAKVHDLCDKLLKTIKSWQASVDDGAFFLNSVPGMGGEDFS